VIFEAKAFNDIHISFNTISSRVMGQDGLEDSPIYEVVIGKLVSFIYMVIKEVG
jgi:hypothetical protein